MSYQLFRKSGGKTWHYRFQIANNRVQRSTRETIKGRADEVANRAYETAVIQSNGGNPVPNLADLVREWQGVHVPVISDHHARSIDTFARLHLYDLGAVPINEITTARVELLRNEHLRTHRPASANHWLRILKLIVNWAVKRKVITRLPWNVRMLKLQKRPRAILPLDVALKWFSAIDNATVREPSVATAVRLMFGLGLRESEAAGARWDWIDWQRKTYTPGETKGREAEPIPIPDWLADHLRPIRCDQGLIAGNSDGNAHPNGFARRAMKVANSVCKTKGITPHRLRGSFATLMSENGVPVQTIQEVMRHKSPLTTIGYLEKNRSTAARVQNEIGEKIGFKRRENGARRESNTTDESTS